MRDELRFVQFVEAGFSTWEGNDCRAVVVCNSVHRDRPYIEAKDPGRYGHRHFERVGEATRWDTAMAIGRLMASDFEHVVRSIGDEDAILAEPLSNLVT